MSTAVFCDEQISAKYIMKYIMCIYMSVSAEKKASSLMQIKKNQKNPEKSLVDSFIKRCKCDLLVAL